MEQLYRWRSMLTDQPKDGAKVLMQYKSFDFEDKKYIASNRDWFIKNVQCWLEPIEESEQDDLDKLLDNDTVLKDIKLGFVKSAIIRLVESQSFKKYSKGYKDGWNEARVPVNQDESISFNQKIKIMEKIKQLLQQARQTLSELKDRRDPTTGEAFTATLYGELAINGVKDWFIDEVEKIVNEQ